MKIPITFLGTGQAIPTVKRNHTSILLEYGDENILVDCGEGTQRQFRKAKINPCKLTRILITHWHGDHVFGLPGLLQTLSLNNYNRTLHVYVPKGTRQRMDLLYRLFVFKEKIKVEVEEVDDGKFLETKDFILESAPMQHDTPCNAYSFIEKNKIRINKQKLKKYKLQGPIVGELARGKDIIWKGKKILAKDMIYHEDGKKIAFILDTGENSNCYKIAKDADLLVCESTFMANSENGKMLAKEYKHLTAEQAGMIAKKSGAKKLALTHLSQRYEANAKPLLAEAKKKFKNTILAEDFMKLEV